MSILLTVIMTVKILGYFAFSESEAVNAILKILLRVSMTGLTVLIYLYYRRVYFTVNLKLVHPLPVSFYSFYLFLAFCSLLWTTDIMFSGKQWFMTTESLVFVLFFYKLVLTYNYAHEKNPIHLNLILGYSIFLICLMLLVGMFINPEKFYRYTHGGSVARLGGLMQNPNEVGMIAVLGAAMTCSLIFEYGIKPIYYFMIVVMAATVFYSQSRSSSIAFLLIIGIYVLHSENRQIKIAMFAGMAILMPIIYFTIFLKEDLNGVSGGVEEILSATGRTDFWKALLMEGFPNNPLFGNGFMRLSFTKKFMTSRAMNASMAHNTFVEVIMNLGLIGISVVILQLTATISAIWQQKDRMERLLMASIFMELFLNSLTEFGIYGHNNYAILFYQLLLVSMLFSRDVRVTRIQKIRMKNAYKISS